MNRLVSVALHSSNRLSGICRPSLARFVALLVAGLALCSTADAQWVNVLPGNNSTSANPRAPQGGRRICRAVYYITPTEMTASGFTGQIGSVGWRYNVPSPPAAGAPVAQNVQTTGIIKVYVQGSTDTGYNKSLTYATAITGMTKIIDGAITIPAGTAEFIIDVPAGGTGTSAFTPVAGEGIYVAYDYQTSTALSTPTAAPQVFCSNVALDITAISPAGAGLASASSQTTTAPATLALSPFRPHTRFGLVGMSACCQPSGACQVVEISTCLAPNLSQGVGSMCNGTAPFCPNPVTACCNFVTATCTYTNGNTCPTGFGTTGSGSVCSPNTCPTTSACCRPDGSCTFGTFADCQDTAIGGGAGSYQFGTSTCTAVVCQQPAACCGPENSTCTTIAGFACVAPNVFMGDGSVCSPTFCPSGACCKPDGACTSVTSTWCSSTGGSYAGDGVTCVAAGCPQPGACCMTNGGCVKLTSGDCGAAGGSFGAPGMLCASHNCWTAPILYHNGGVVTLPAGGLNGADASQLAPGANTIGANFSGTNRVSCEFSIPPGQTWDITKFRTLGYQTLTVAPANPPVNTFTSMRVRILDRDPRLPGAQVLWGDLTTNVLDTANSPFANAFRTGAATPMDSLRPLFDLRANIPNLHLGPGSYWVEYSASNGATAFIPPVQVPGAVLYGTALQVGTVRIVDTGFATASWVNAGGFPHGLPFILEGAVGAFVGVCCQDNGGCFAAAAGPTCATGTLVANGTCAPNACPQPQVGVCCQPDGSCGVATPGIPAATCNTGTLVVNGTCTPNTCPQTGICCQADGSCTAATSGVPAATCATGTLSVAGTCTPNTCPAPIGVCCTAGACTYIADVSGVFTCQSGGGTANTSVTSCTPDPCAPQGVCCRGATCSDDVALQSQAACAASVNGQAGGTFIATGPCGGTNHLSPCCYADYNKIGGKNVTDIFAYLTDWFAARPWAVLGGNGTGAPAVGHIFNFLTDWFGPNCP